MTRLRLNWLIGLFYAFVFVPTGVGISFFPLWLRDHGLDVVTLGFIAAIGFASKIIVNPLASYVAARFSLRLPIVVGLSAISALLTSLYIAGAPVAILALAFLLVGVLSSPIMPLGDAVMLTYIRAHALSFGSLRLWGSVTVLATVVVTGIAFERGYQDWSVGVIPASYLVLFTVFIFLKQDQKKVESVPLFPFAILKDKNVLSFVLIAAPLQSVHGLFYTYSTIYWIESGYSPLFISLLWAVGITSEVCVFFLASQYRSASEPIALLGLAALAGMFRWGALYYSDAWQVAALVQIAQGFSLALLQVAVAEYFLRTVQDESLVMATSTYSALAYGLFQALAVSAGGLIFIKLGGGAVFGLAALVCVCALLALLSKSWFARP